MPARSLGPGAVAWAGPAAVRRRQPNSPVRQPATFRRAQRPTPKSQAVGFDAFVPPYLFDRRGTLADVATGTGFRYNWLLLARRNPIALARRPIHRPAAKGLSSSARHRGCR